MSLVTTFLSYRVTLDGISLLVLDEQWFTVERPANLIRVLIRARRYAVPDFARDLKVDLTLFDGLVSHGDPGLSNVEP